MDKPARVAELLDACVDYIADILCAYGCGYFDTVDKFKELGFTEKELAENGIRDFEFEYELYCEAAENKNPLSFDEWFAEEYGKNNS